MAFGAILGSLASSLTRAVSPIFSRTISQIPGVLSRAVTTGAPTAARAVGRAVTRPGIVRTAVGTAAGVGAFEAGRALLVDPATGQVVERKKRRRMDVLNMKALDRSLRRIEGFQRRIDRVTKITRGPKRTVRTKRKCRR